MSGVQSPPRWALDVSASQADGYDLAERLGFDELQDALAVSVFDDERGGLTVQALYASEAEARAAKAGLPEPARGTVARLPDEDWVSLTQAGLPPIDAGRFIVHGSHDEPDTTERIPILVDAGAAFGTGHHGTTKGCLLMLSDLDDIPATVLDLGTGAGLLAIAAAKLFPAADILATDIDPDAVEVARANARLNGVDFPCLHADGFDDAALKDRRFDLILANILAGPLRGLAPDIAAALAPGGTAILSGILDAQADWVGEAFEACELRVQKRPSLDSWTSLFAYRGEP